MKKEKRVLSQNKYIEEADDDLIICRCEEISKGEIRKAVYAGMHTVNEVKRFLRTGMGLCQGQNCNRLVRNVIAKELGVSPVELDFQTPRAPQRPIPMAVFAKDGMK
jgi:NAD(P)H-nitrite reductase large subunit